MTMPPVDSSGAWSWVSNLLAPTGVLALFGLLFGYTQTRITDVQTKAKAELDAVKDDLEKDVADLRAMAVESQRSHTAMLVVLRELPTRTEMQHDLEVMEARLYDRINHPPKDHH